MQFEYVLPISIAFVISFLMTPLVIKLANHVGAIDDPKDDRRVHKVPIPRLGGLAMYIAFFVTMFVFTDYPMDKSLGLFIGATILVFVGMVDDINPLSAKVKFALQVVAACILVAYGFRINGISNYFGNPADYIFLDWLSYPITVLWIVGITNTMNLIDGLDGLAAGISAISATTMAYIALLNGRGEVALLTLILAASCFGFLPFNFNPARIFMGDTGSMFLGFTLSAISIDGALKGATALTVWIPILLALGLPLFDMGFAILRRIVNRQSIAEADKGHIHHRFLQLGLHQKRTVIYMYMLSVMLGIGSVLFLSGEIVNSFIFVSLVGIMLLILIQMSSKDVGKELQ